MKIKPIVIDRFLITHLSFVIDFQFTNNITILAGISGTGRTLCFTAIKESLDPNIICINYLFYQKDIAALIRKETGKLIVIDNADIRKYISLDDKNQYLIIGRNPKNLFATIDNLFELKSEKEGEQTIFRLVSFYNFEK